ncbi:MAG: hypothetical protein A2694_00730 [Candidatus Blackburnbacteria bacterium RIFCSPHIGHO2_01_FULL_40_17]|uniref:Glycosyltransferase RgtA/B/C/D-like domain-containing protein n=1 Tax=Candidatus Blackburnbacteria bacterium RIFCSPLOWO2_01_FULL_40_20 TaxID=1797519 RepID=A0A1G1VCH8_9BACT|nr:MAG: hypothetical protein UT38_C0025G0004 [Microgenomates group bacterium GW2011_GWA2_39_19]OGY06829.1 MAG: hypothetical protein A2694_00730 [Candidatus Blackburnbacteria bacterium RIFCSPHIGHO2_01_FULL_40_17]OGY12987.1 MAG: hypothetical protein A3A77_01585 [Candidatus Blackburnbacteria bacterium RIFCSPLOWO2_01_FULL_40_20]HBL51756.1 hypothetical protein [Candidatus Blackburnbacteria bacterium]
MLKKYYKTFFYWTVILLVAFAIRFSIANTWVRGDVLVFKEWGEKFWKIGPREFYFVSDKVWYYSPPTQPPISNLIYGASYWLFNNKQVLPQIHNSTHLIPSEVIDYFYDMPEPFNKKGLIFLLKLPAILADLGLGLLIFWIVKSLSKSKTKAYVGAIAYLFNPVSIFISSGWGQTESLLALFGLSSFVLLGLRKTYLSLPLFFLCLYTKPTWLVFIPLYVFILLAVKPKVRHLVWGVLISAALFLLTTYPFSGLNFVSFIDQAIIKDVFNKAGGARASISAFNFHTIFLRIDWDLDNHPILGIPANTLGKVLFSLTYVFTIIWLKRQKISILNIMVAIFSIGFGTFLLLPSMLERYFFAGFAPALIVGIVHPKALLFVISLNIVVFVNLVYAFFKRSWTEMDVVFTSNNFLLIKVLSVVAVLSWWKAVRKFGIISRGGLARRCRT